MKKLLAILIIASFILVINVAASSRFGDGTVTYKPGSKIDPTGGVTKKGTEWDETGSKEEGGKKQVTKTDIKEGGVNPNVGLYLRETLSFVDRDNESRVIATNTRDIKFSGNLNEKLQKFMAYDVRNLNQTNEEICDFLGVDYDVAVDEEYKLKAEIEVVANLYLFQAGYDKYKSNASNLGYGPGEGGNFSSNINRWKNWIFRKDNDNYDSLLKGDTFIRKLLSPTKQREIERKCQDGNRVIDIFIDDTDPDPDPDPKDKESESIKHDPMSAGWVNYPIDVVITGYNSEGSNDIETFSLNERSGNGELDKQITSGTTVTITREGITYLDSNLVEKPEEREVAGPYKIDYVDPEIEITGFDITEKNEIILEITDDLSGIDEIQYKIIKEDTEEEFIVVEGNNQLEQDLTVDAIVEKIYDYLDNEENVEIFVKAYDRAGNVSAVHEIIYPDDIPKPPGGGGGGGKSSGYILHDPMNHKWVNKPINVFIDGKNPNPREPDSMKTIFTNDIKPEERTSYYNPSTNVTIERRGRNYLHSSLIYAGLSEDAGPYRIDYYAPSVDFTFIETRKTDRGVEYIAKPDNKVKLHVTDDLSGIYTIDYDIVEENETVNFKRLKTISTPEDLSDVSYIDIHEDNVYEKLKEGRVYLHLRLEDHAGNVFKTYKSQNLWGNNNPYQSGDNVKLIINNNKKDPNPTRPAIPIFINKITNFVITDVRDSRWVEYFENDVEVPVTNMALESTDAGNKIPIGRMVDFRLDTVGYTEPGDDVEVDTYFMLKSGTGAMYKYIDIYMYDNNLSAYKKLAEHTDPEINIFKKFTVTEKENRNIYESSYRFPYYIPYTARYMPYNTNTFNQTTYRNLDGKNILVVFDVKIKKWWQDEYTSYTYLEDKWGTSDGPYARMYSTWLQKEIFDFNTYGKDYDEYDGQVFWYTLAGADYERGAGVDELYGVLTD